MHGPKRHHGDLARGGVGAKHLDFVQGLLLFSPLLLLLVPIVILLLLLLLYPHLELTHDHLYLLQLHIRCLLLSCAASPRSPGSISSAASCRL
jgi:hypothetical protein